MGSSPSWADALLQYLRLSPVAPESAAAANGTRQRIDMKPKVKSEETRLLILETALGLFRKNSFEKTTMRDIASTAGVALGAAYYYYDSKDAMVLAFYEKAQKEMEPELRG